MKCKVCAINIPTYTEDLYNNNQCCSEECLKQSKEYQKEYKEFKAFVATLTRKQIARFITIMEECYFLDFYYDEWMKEVFK